jgi:hypothetical protein
MDSSRDSYCNEVMAGMERAGMKFIQKKHAPLPDSSPYASGYNYIFARSS